MRGALSRPAGLRRARSWGSTSPRRRGRSAGWGAPLGWGAAEWVRTGKPTALGAISGAVAGLVGITPASGFVTPMSGLAIGFITGLGCYLAVTVLKKRLGYDDALDVFGVHGAGGTIGALLTGVFATSAINPIFKDAAGNVLPVGLLEGNGVQLLNQLLGVGLTIGIACVASFAILKIVDLFIGLRVSEEQELTGLDLSLHGEAGYHLGAESAFARVHAAEAPEVGVAGYKTEVALENAGGD